MVQDKKACNLHNPTQSKPGSKSIGRFKVNPAIYPYMVDQMSNYRLVVTYWLKILTLHSGSAALRLLKPIHKVFCEEMTKHYKFLPISLNDSKQSPAK